MRILLVDDEEEFASALAERLCLRGFETDWVSSGQDALRKIQEKVYDLAVVDIKMPHISGVELMELIKEKTPGMKFIVLTGHSEGRDQSQTPVSGARFHLIKPVDIQLLVDIIRQALGE